MDLIKPYQGELDAMVPSAVSPQEESKINVWVTRLILGVAPDNCRHLHIPVLQGHGFYSRQRSKFKHLSEHHGLHPGDHLRLLIIGEVSEVDPTIWPG